jgi:hypothetical protein
MVSGRQTGWPESKRECEGLDPCRASRTQPTPRLYCSEGLPSCLWRLMATDRVVRSAGCRSGWEKPLEWRHEQPGLDASFSTNRPPLRVAKILREGEEGPLAPGATTCEPGDLPSVTGIMPTWGEIPVANTEVVLATFDRCGPLGSRRGFVPFVQRPSAQLGYAAPERGNRRLRLHGSVGAP